MFKGTQQQKWITLAWLAVIGLAVAFKYPHPTMSGQPLLLIIMTLLFVKNWLEYLLYLPITGLLGVLIEVAESARRKQFLITNLITYAVLLYWLLGKLYPG